MGALSRFPGLIAVALTVLVAATAAQASGDCHPPYQPGLIAACTAVIDNPAETVADRAEALRLRAYIHYQSRDFDGAIADFTANIALVPDKAQAYRDRGLAYLGMKDYRKAISDYDRAIALDPSNSYGYIKRADAFEHVDEFERAGADYDAAIRIEPRDLYYFLRGLFNLQRSDVDGAVADFSAVIRLDPKNAEAYIYRGDLRMKRHEYEGAIADYTKILDLTPGKEGILLNRAAAFVKLGDLEHALADQDTVIKLKPDNARVRNMRAHIRFTVGRYADAAEDFDDVVVKSPEYVLGKLLRYISHERAGGNGDLAALRRDANALDRDGFVWPIFAVYLGERTPEQLRAAVKDMKVEDNYGDCGVAFYLGQHAMVQGRSDDALPLLKQAAEVCRGDGEFERDAARAELKRLQAGK